MIKHFVKSISAVLAATVLCAGLAVPIPAKAYTEFSAPDHNIAVTADSFAYLEELGSDYFGGISVKALAYFFYQQLSQKKTSIEINKSEYNVTDYNKCFKLLNEVIKNWDGGLIDNPSSTRAIPKSTKITITVEYYDADYDAYSGKLEEVIARVDKGWQDWEKALYLHDYIAVHFDYNYDQLNNSQYTEKHTAYGMLKDGQAVCEGYANLYSMALHRVGVDATTVSATSSQGNHAWNLVKIGDTWYHVDITHDDCFHGDFPGHLRHINFLRGNSVIHEYQRYEDGTTYTQASFSWGNAVSSCASVSASDPENYDKAFWTEFRSGSALDYIGACEPIYIDNDPSKVMWMKYTWDENAGIKLYLCDADDVSDEPTKINLFDNNQVETNAGDALPNPYTQQWGYGDSNGNTFGYSGLVSHDNVVFFNDSHNVYAFYNQTVVTVRADNSQNKIFGLEEEEGHLKYYTANSPNADENSPGTKMTETVDLGDINTVIESVKVETAKIPEGADEDWPEGNGAINFDDLPANFLPNELRRFEDWTYKTWIPPQNYFTDDYFDYPDQNLPLGFAMLKRDGYYGRELSEGDLIFGSSVISSVYYSWVLKASSATLSDTVRFNFRLNLEAQFTDTQLNTLDPEKYGAYMTIQSGDNEQIKYFNEPVSYDSRKQEYTYSIEIPFSKLNDTIIITPHLNGYTTAPITLTPSTYFDQLSNDSTYGGVASATTVLGAYANKYFDNDLSMLQTLEANSGDGTNQSTAYNNVKGASIPQYVSSVQGSLPEGVSYVGSTLMFTGDVKVRNYFQTDGNVELGADSFELENNTHDFNMKVVCKNADKHLYYVEISGIKAALLGENYTLSFKRSDFKLNYSAMCNASAIANNTQNKYTEDQKDLMKALYCYYFEAHQLLTR